MTNGDPGPIVAERDGRGGTYFLLPPGSTLRKRWPVGAVRYNAQTAETGYVPVPALSGDTWPFSWRCPPGEPGRFVHPLLLCNAIVAVRLVTPAAEEFVSRARGT